jgi:hypothetical protein
MRRYGEREGDYVVLVGRANLLGVHGHHRATVMLTPHVDAGFCSAFCSAVVVVRIESVSWGRNLRLPSVKSEQLQIAASTIYSWPVAYIQGEGAPGAIEACWADHAFLHQLVQYLPQRVTAREWLRGCSQICSWRAK